MLRIYEFKNLSIIRNWVKKQKRAAIKKACADCATTFSLLKHGNL